ncbi:MAG: hypothetical protein ACYS21_15965, partial [Planctomycetota bacterium]
NTWDANVIEEDPEFTNGYYLSHIAAGQDVNSPCIDVGSADAHDVGMNTYTTRTDGVNDVCDVDMGYHYDDGLTRYELTVTVLEDPCDPGIHGDVEPNSGWYYDGAELTLEGKPDPNYFVR